MILPLKDTIAAQKSRAYRFGYSGMVLIVKGHEELFFEVTDRKSRDTFRDLLEHHLELKRVEVTSPGMPFALQEAKTLEELQTPTAIFNEEQPEDHDVPAIMFKSNSSSFLDFKPKTSLHFVCLTIGTLLAHPLRD